MSRRPPSTFGKVHHGCIRTRRHWVAGSLEVLYFFHQRRTFMSIYSVKKKGWRYDFTLKGTRHTDQWFKTKREAKQAEVERRKEVLKNIGSPINIIQTDMTFLELINKWLDHVQAYKSKEYYKTNRNMARHWVRLWGHVLCSEFITEMIEKRLIERKKVSAYSANKELRHLRVIFNFGKKKFNIIFTVILFSFSDCFSF